MGVADIPSRGKDNDSNCSCRSKGLRYAIRIVPDLVKLPATRYSLSSILSISTTYMITTHPPTRFVISDEKDLRVTMRGVSDLPIPDNPRIQPVVHNWLGNWMTRGMRQRNREEPQPLRTSWSDTR